MGCDIHIRIQVQEGDEWKTVPYREEPYVSREKLKSGEDYYRREWEAIDAWKGVVMPNAFTSRNYNLFGMLADVRNGTWGDEWPALAPHRGLPNGVDSDGDEHELAEATGEYWLGDHSHTVISLEELEGYGWDSITVKGRGYVPAEEFDALAPGQKPDGYSAGIFGGNAVIYTPEAWAAQGRRKAHPEESPYIQARWRQTAREGCRDWPGEVLPRLREIAAGRPLRLLIGFDN